MGFDGSGALGGAMSGAGVGATFGPVGAVIGGLGGGLLGGLFGGGESEEDRRKRIQQELEAQYGAANLNNVAYQGGADRGQRFLNAANQAQGRNVVGQLYDPTQSGFRADQQALVGQLQRQALGQGPSVAAQQAKLQNQQAVANQFAMMRSGQGGAAAKRAAMQNASMQQGSLAGQSALARTQEQLGAISQLGNVLSGARGQDNTYQNMLLGRSQAQAGLNLQQQGQNDAQQRAMLQQEMQNALYGQQAGLQQEQFRQQLMQNYLNRGQSNQPSMGDQLLGMGSTMLPIGLQMLQNRNKGGGTPEGA